MPLLRLAARQAVRQRRRSLLTLIAIGFSVAVVIAAKAVLNGTQALLEARIVSGQVGAVQVHKKGFMQSVSAAPLDFAFDASVVERIAKVPGVIAATARLPFFTMANAGDRTIYTSAVGVEPKGELRALPNRAMEWGDARVSQTAGIVSPEVARQLGGRSSQSSLSLLATDADGVLNAENLSISGVVGDNPKLSSERKMIYLPLSLAQTLLRAPGKALEVVVRGDDPEALAGRISLALGDTFEVHTWKQIAPFAAQVLKAQKAALHFVVMVFVIVLLLGITNAMLMNVLSRTRDIGTMMALGMTRRKILALFVAESSFLGAIGAVCGAALGICLVILMHHFGIRMRAPGALHADEMRPFVASRFVFATVVAAMLGAALAAIYPARRAAKMTPVDALAGR